MNHRGGGGGGGALMPPFLAMINNVNTHPIVPHDWTCTKLSTADIQSEVKS